MKVYNGQEQNLGMVKIHVMNNGQSAAKLLRIIIYGEGSTTKR
ncbi:hypothetical protein PBCVNW6652_320R [Paramecium bursaria Chlorella virus NW665.2]|nr:hypothetical protein PBCVNW6652_320R [Paramecium bursaria Chlorella virus NW665.2]